MGKEKVTNEELQSKRFNALADDFKDMKFDPKNDADIKMQSLKILSNYNMNFEFNGPDGVQYYSSELARQMPFIEKFAKLNEPVLINGPTGTGKELIAKLIHDTSPRCKGNFIPVNCGGLNEETLISELFGHVKGAFTGAIANKKGAVDQAEKGTLFLDEIGDMPPLAQVKLLRFLNDGTFQRLGALGENKKSDVRIICATNNNLPQLIKEGKFREDLFYRIKVFSVVLPPLSIMKLIEKTYPERSFSEVFLHLAVEFGYVAKENKFSYDLPQMSAAALNVLRHYNYPGNYRELINILKHALVKCNGKVIKKEDLPDDVRGPVSNDKGNDLSSLPADKFIPGVNKLIFERLRCELDKGKGNVSAAAKAFGITNTRFDRILNRAKNGDFL